MPIAAVGVADIVVDIVVVAVVVVIVDVAVVVAVEDVVVVVAVVVVQTCDPRRSAVAVAAVTVEGGQQRAGQRHSENTLVAVGIDVVDTDVVADIDVVVVVVVDAAAAAAVVVVVVVVVVVEN